MDLEDAIDVIDYSKFEADKFYFSNVTGSCTIADTSNFIVKIIELAQAQRIVPTLKGSFTVYTCVEGEAAIKTNDGTVYPLKKGETIFIPAAMEDFQLIPVNGTPQILESYMPQLADSPDLYLNYDEPEDEAHGSYKDTVPAEDDEDDECDCGCDHDHNHDCGCHGHHSHPGETFFK